MIDDCFHNFSRFYIEIELMYTKKLFKGMSTLTEAELTSNLVIYGTMKFVCPSQILICYAKECIVALPSV
jgi:hypothetical protein